MGLRRVLDHSVKEARQLLHTGQRRLIHLLLERLRNRIIHDQFLGRAEPLSLIGNLGPLVGLAGTVWGMILAFTSLGETGGQAGPTELSEGISKALFHTLLGLVLAVPCLLAFGYFRAKIDTICTDAIARTARIVGHIPAGADCPEALEPGKDASP